MSLSVRGATWLTWRREGVRRPVHAQMSQLMTAASDRGTSLAVVGSTCWPES